MPGCITSVVVEQMIEQMEWLNFSEPKSLVCGPRVKQALAGACNEPQGPPNHSPRRALGPPVCLSLGCWAEVPCLGARGRLCMLNSPGCSLTSILGNGKEALLEPTSLPPHGSPQTRDLVLRHYVCPRNGVGCREQGGLRGEGAYLRIAAPEGCYLEPVLEVSSWWCSRDRTRASRPCVASAF